MKVKIEWGQVVAAQHIRSAGGRGGCEDLDLVRLPDGREVIVSSPTVDGRVTPQITCEYADPSIEGVTLPPSIHVSAMRGGTESQGHREEMIIQHPRIYTDHMVHRSQVTDYIPIDGPRMRRAVRWAAVTAADPLSECQSERESLRLYGDRSAMHYIGSESVRLAACASLISRLHCPALRDAIPRHLIDTCSPSSA